MKTLNSLKDKLKDKRGSEMVEFIIGLALKLGVLMTCLFALCFLYNSLKLYAVCDKVTRSISVSGVYDQRTEQLVDALVGDALVVTTAVDANYFNAAQGQIQLRDTFKVTLSSTYDIPVITPLSDGDTFYIKIPIKVWSQGISEKFWR